MLPPLLATVKTNALQNVAATQRTSLHSLAAHLTAAHVATGQKDDLSLHRDDGRGESSQFQLKPKQLYMIIKINTPASMQTTHSELPRPPTGLEAEGVTGVPGLAGEPGVWKTVALGSSGGLEGGKATAAVPAFSFVPAAAAESKTNIARNVQIAELVLSFYF